MEAENNLKNFEPALRQGFKMPINSLDSTGATTNDVVTFDGTDVVWGAGGGAGTVIKIGEIDFNDLNSGTTFTFVDGKPAGYYTTGAFLKTLETFESYSGDFITTSSSVLTDILTGPANLNTAGVVSSIQTALTTPGLALSFNDAQDIIVLISLNLNNQDWYAGKMGVYIVVNTIPTLA